MSYRLIPLCVAAATALAVLPAAVNANAAGSQTRAEVKANLLTVSELTPKSATWEKQTYHAGNGANQKGPCNVDEPRSRFGVGRAWLDKHDAISEIVRGDAFSTAKKARRSVTRAYDGEKTCSSYKTGALTAYDQSRFKSHFEHTTAYCTTDKSRYKHQLVQKAGICRFVRADVRYDVYVQRVSHGGVRQKLQVLTSRAVHKVYGS